MPERFVVVCAVTRPRRSPRRPVHDAGAVAPGPAASSQSSAFRSCRHEAVYAGGADEPGISRLQFVARVSVARFL